MNKTALPQSGRDEIHSLNLNQVLELFERYRQNPDSVDEFSRSIFERGLLFADGDAPESEKVDDRDIPAWDQIKPSPEKAKAAIRLANSIRRFGHLSVSLDPLGFFDPPGDAALVMESYGLSEEDLIDLPSRVVEEGKGDAGESALDAITTLRQVYQGSVGYDYNHIHNPVEREWLRLAAENGLFRQPYTVEESTALLKRLTQVESFEKFLQRSFPGKTRFSIEGLDILIPMLDETLDQAAQAGICTIILGMPHRGRLNVLAHVLSVPYEQLLKEFKDPSETSAILKERGSTGDVKYHQGGNYAAPGGREIRIIVKMPPIPSHLELVDPVVEGMTRAWQSNVEGKGTPVVYPDASLPILIHGDASFPGEGIVAETLNLSRLAGYQVGGTLHIIANNQLGYTTYPQQGRSTLYASDLAKGFEIPVIHVNADEPPACREAVLTAVAYRQRFHKDFLIDLVGYRRHGHNEGDEPAFTQPLLYNEINKHPSVREIWANGLEQQGIIEKEAADKLLQENNQILQAAMGSIASTEQSLTKEIKTKTNTTVHVKPKPIHEKELLILIDSLLKVPTGFTLHPKLRRAMETRRKILESPETGLVDWAMAEQLALASILAEGTSIRMTGQDVERGTFSQRHAVFHDALTADPYTPLQTIPQAKATFEIHNSPLSEAAAFAFEYGYNIQNPTCLVIWEAQYGDFVNNAQSILDEFFLSGSAKWSQHSSIVLLLPHGDEGQGPNHSSSRPERFLQLANHMNFRLTNCTSAAQYFHLLRDQANQPYGSAIPLVVLTPKSLLRNPQTASSLKELSKGRWLPVLDDERAKEHPSDIRRLLIGSGKITLEIMESNLRDKSKDLGIIRLEQLYPFPKSELSEVLARYDKIEQIDWVQEEPENMGAWTFARTRISELIGSKLVLGYIGREESSSPAAGSFASYKVQQEQLIERALRSARKAKVSNRKSSTTRV